MPGANTLGHIREATGVELPNLARLGLWSAVNLAADTEFPGPAPQGLWGAATERSRGKDTPSGHWELAGVPVPWAWHYFPRTVPAFPPEITAALIARARLPGILGDCHASGTEIIARLGAEHLRTGRPICYTSADSVMQIAAHEEGFGLARLYEVCEIAAELVHPLRVGAGHRAPVHRQPRRLPPHRQPARLCHPPARAHPARPRAGGPAGGPSASARSATSSPIAACPRS
ncbi:MAG: hypothetical protein KatS3mg118_3728 [Paracoccaceae bacterium]|nr:MAG: hypothetical protein KatS3mg118_3728 [Paracoccaceae bacterium]